MKIIYILLVLFAVSPLRAEEKRANIQAWIAFSASSQKLGETISRLKGGVDPTTFDDVRGSTNRDLELLVKLGELSQKKLKIKIPDSRDEMFKRLDFVFDLSEKFGVYSVWEMTGLTEVLFGKGEINEVIELNVRLPKKDLKFFVESLEKGGLVP